MIEELKERCAKLGSAIGSIESEIVADRQKVDKVIGRIGGTDDQNKPNDQELSDELDSLEMKYGSELAALKPKAKVKPKPAPKVEVK